jgi:dTDP-4-amino-4,6-dideoxygalactose transaminase
MIPAFEREFAQAYGVPYAVASTSGTAAIHTALGALDLNPGDEVITAPITDLGTVVPILYQNCIPVFADIDETYNMDPFDVERKITPRTRAIISVHLFGNPCDTDRLLDVARGHNIPLIEDCAQAHVTEYKGKYVGTIGDIGCFSFQQSKHMTTGEGGMTVTSNREYYERMKFFIDKGWARKGWGPRAYLFLAPNYRPTELVGAIGLAQLKKVQDVVRKRHELGEYLSELLSNIEGVRPAPVTSGAKHSYWLYPMKVEGIDLNLLAQEMAKERISASVGYTGKPIYLCTEALTAKKTYGSSQCPYSCMLNHKNYEYKEGLCPRAEDALKHLICIPLNESWTKKDVERTANAVRKCMNRLVRDTNSVSFVKFVKQKTLAPSTLTAERNASKIRVGIIGCGQMGQWHFDAYRSNPNVQLVSFVDTDITRAEKFISGVGGRAYRSHKEMIEKEKLDGVSICTVPATHKQIGLDCLDAGINVLCEKPLAISGAEALEMTRRQKKRDCFS